ncbi:MULTISPECIES: metallophosphoesterase family protein [Psychrilyobacter]|uniref:Phosphoesterase n=1 Tax=Psychrilyobacter piezotolerans TaxID=2293438 RepID=A0ABX9KHN0_9FUSO|nr:MULTISPECIES: metallophosphoesterase [Psychrilyobacter]MCS5421165.1 metallophosphoesterase [Psychrilyobacter sp. S5]NDI77920.1 metallophosphoesterase [Psychrilyobacter piezotolerans]RDE62037.1 metallophosphoesterase [Psychrilyobacter sp. S5]REI41284.1 YfcE family phosphodiesterase [Psychrilyobacter piezotolerans]
MKVLIVSDSHSRLDNLMKIWEKEVPDVVISAGDYSKDVEELSYIYEDSEYYIVRGNCDYMDNNTEDNLEFELSDKKIFLTHGHLYGVKTSYDYLRMEANDRGTDLCIFGHTHIPYLEEEGMILFNPGAVKDGLYGILEINNDKINIEHRKL